MDFLADTIGGIALALMVFCVLFQVFVRYFINLLGMVLFAWTEGLARFLLIFVTFWGAAVALRRKEHITIPILIDRISPRMRPFLLFVSIAIMGFFWRW
ncbi:MAG: TRAP transporter small permease [Candidatus Caldatribacteriaceae bacterium]